MKNLINLTAEKGFQKGSHAYLRGRPDYPQQAIQFLIEAFQLTPRSHILDLAAGTGKFTQSLLSLQANVCAVEPVPAMRKKFHQLLPSIPIFEGTAEQIPTASEIFDCVFVAQAFHWFRAFEATKEIHRVLKPRGKIGLLWNVRDESHSWVREMSQLLNFYEGNTPRYKNMQWILPFEQRDFFKKIQLETFDHFQEGSEDDILDRVASISFIAALPLDKHHEALNEMRNILKRHFDQEQRRKLRLPYKTHVYWSEKL